MAKSKKKKLGTNHQFWTEPHFYSLLAALVLLGVGYWHLKESVETDVPQYMPLFFGMALLSFNNKLRYPERSTIIVALVFTVLAFISILLFYNRLVAHYEVLSQWRVYIMLFFTGLSAINLSLYLYRNKV
ncbi:MAG TPA: hypothetical protein PK147_04230 [Saprospiraceae bacterium]|nr:hypothetical protein [Saprospiraceae bacterium]HPQ21032.1 hypothetical protein [Saprospiraceae bacterium]HRX30113.1 hypothetical protein [Saprospiraceae bacterium]